MTPRNRRDGETDGICAKIRMPIFLKSVAEEVLNAGIHREFSRMKFTGEDKDIQDEAGKKLTFVSKMISELKALLLLGINEK